MIHSFLDQVKNFNKSKTLQFQALSTEQIHGQCRQLKVQATPNFQTKPVMKDLKLTGENT